MTDDPPPPRPDASAAPAPESPLEPGSAVFQQLLQQLPVPLLFVAADQTVGFVNDEFVRRFGYTRADIPTQAEWRRRAYPDPAYREHVIATWQAAAAEAKHTDGRLTGEFQVTTKSGDLHRVEVTAVPLLGGMLGTLFDVTARRSAEQEAGAAQAEAARLLAAAEQSRRVLLSVVEDQKETEQALRTNEERYRSLVETSFDWIWEVDPEGRYTYASPRVETLLGYKPEELVGRTPFDLMPADEAARARAVFAELTAARRPFVALEKTNRHRDGHLVILETRGVPVFAPDGAWLGYRGTDRDVTARRAAEKTLRLHDAVLQAAANAVLITDRQGTIEWANPAFSTMSGWSLNEIVGQNPRVLRSGKHDAAFYRQMWAALAGGQVWRGEIVNRRKDGELRTENVTITPLRDAGGRITHFIAIKQDITAQKLMEQQFLQAQRMEAIGTLAGGIAHDLNNILAPILMISAVLKEKLASEEDQELVAMTQVSAKRGADIVKQLLAFSRGHVGERASVQLRHLIKEMGQMMRETFPREIDLRQHVAGDLWPVVADPSQLHQVLLNLCVNARDAMPAGGRLDLTARNATLAAGDPILPPSHAAGPYVAIDVSDTGSGIPAEIRHRIFDPFFTTKPVGKGTGLGLSTVLAIVQNHGGFVTVESTPSRGSTFRIHLPAAPDAAEAIAHSPAPPMAPPLPSPGRHTILVVDDEREIRDAARLLLQQQKYRVLTATQGEEALALFLQHRAEIQLVVTDLMMPVMGGVALARALRAVAPTIRIVATSGLNEIASRIELEALGVGDVLMKPYEASSLIEIVRRKLSEA